MQKFAILLPIVTGIILVATISFQSSHAQQSSSTPINFTNFFLENNCNPLSVGGTCVPTITVLYEDQSTVALKSGYVDSIWAGVAEVKKYGYKIDGMTSFPISDYTGDTKVNILVVMSK